MSTSRSTQDKRRQVVRVAVLVALPLAGVAAAWWFTRPRPVVDQLDHAVSAAPVTPHDMSSMPGMSAANPDSTATSLSLSADQARRIGVTFAPVTNAPLHHEIRTVGQISIDETRISTIALKVDGWVESLVADFVGRTVMAGESLLRVYSPTLVAAQDELLLARKMARDVSSADIETRTKADDLVAAARRRLVEWDMPESEISAIEREGRSSRLVTVISRASGVVVEKRVTAGQRVMAGEPIFQLADLRSVWLVAEVFEQDLRAIRVGLSARASFDAMPGEEWSGRIAYVYPLLSSDSKTVRVRVALTNSGLRLKPGMFATLHIAADAASNAVEDRSRVLSVPRSAVLITGERTLVFIRRADGRLEPRTVTLGGSSDERVEVLRGVALGDTVVASATFLLDAESNLGTAMGGMGDMPGMEITVPPSTSTKPTAAPTRPTNARRKPAER